MNIFDVTRGARPGTPQYIRLTNDVERIHCGFGREWALEDKSRAVAREWMGRGGFEWSRRHILSRVVEYHLRKSRPEKSTGRTYLEVTTPEKEILGSAEAGGCFFNEAMESGDFKVVEVGYNSRGEVCKVGVVLMSPIYQERCLERSRCSHGGFEKRILFACVGTDRGVKTFYITPGYKHRAAYLTK